MSRPIEAENLTRTFGNLVAVNSINLTVEEGEVFGFLGPNGAGKSTAVRMLTTLLKPTGVQPESPALTLHQKQAWLGKK